MSFLPYAKPPPAMWLASFTGSSVLHGGLVAAMVTSSVALLPEAVRNPPRTPDYEVTLEILDANIIDMTEAETDTSLIPEDAIALVPDDGLTNALEETTEALLTPEEEPLLEPETALPDPVQEDVAELIQPEPTVDEVIPEPALEPEAITPEPTEPDVADLTPDVAVPLPIPEPEDPDVMAIDDFSPIDTAEISPLAEVVAPAAAPQAVQPTTVTAPDVVTLAPDVTEDTQIAAVILPEETTPVIETPSVVLPEIVPEPTVLEPEVIETVPDVVETVPDEVEPAEEPSSIDLAALPADEPSGIDLSTVTEPDTTEPSESVTTPDPNAPQVLNAPDPATVVIGALIQRIRATPSAQCTLALPRRAGPEGVGVSFIGGQEAALDAFSARLLNGLSPLPVQTREIIDQRQCALLDAVRQIDDYPAGRIGLAIENTSLRTGDTLQGRVVGAGGLFVTLLLIDDNGVVQDMSRFTTLDGNDPVFEAPVARFGPARATRQIILALGSETAPIDISDQIGREAQDVFSSLPPDVLQSAVFGLATVDIR